MASYYSMKIFNVTYVIWRNENDGMAYHVGFAGVKSLASW
jgi:hypothetical protein